MKKTISLLLLLAMLISCIGCFAETVPGATDAVEETMKAETAETAAEETEIETAPEADADEAQNSEETVVEDPGFGKTEDPLAWLRVALAAVGAFAIAFMYSRQQHMKNRRRK